MPKYCKPIEAQRLTQNRAPHVGSMKICRTSVGNSVSPQILMIGMQASLQMFSTVVNDVLTSW